MMSGASETKDGITTIILEGPPGCYKKHIARGIIRKLGACNWSYISLFATKDQRFPTIENSSIGASYIQEFNETPKERVILVDGPLFFYVRMLGFGVSAKRSLLRMATSLTRAAVDPKKCLHLAVFCRDTPRQWENTLREFPAITKRDLSDINNLYAKYYGELKEDFTFVDTTQEGPLTIASRIARVISESKVPPRATSL